MFPYRQPQIYLQIFVQFQVLLFFSPTDIFFGPNPQKLNHVEWDWEIDEAILSILHAQPTDQEIVS